MSCSFRSSFVSVVVVSLASLSCKDQAKVAETHAVAHAERLAALADEDVEEVRRGLPLGAKSLGSVWNGRKDAELDPNAVRRALDRVRDETRDLAVAKSTFFTLTDDKGKILRSDQEPDHFAGQSLVASFPALSRALAGEPTETRGSMPEAAGARSGGDEQWLAAAPVRDAEGKVRGVYATGWSMRRFAYHLEEVLKHDLTTEALRAEKDKPVKLPLVYVFVIAGHKVYGAPVTPLVNAEALEKLDLAAKTQAGVFHQTLEITGRDFGVAARRAPKMGADIGIAVLRSET